MSTSNTKIEALSSNNRSAQTIKRIHHLLVLISQHRKQTDEECTQMEESGQHQMLRRKKTPSIDIREALNLLATVCTFTPDCDSCAIAPSKEPSSEESSSQYWDLYFTSLPHTTRILETDIMPRWLNDIRSLFENDTGIRTQTREHRLAISLYVDCYTQWSRSLLPATLSNLIGCIETYHIEIEGKGKQDSSWPSLQRLLTCLLRLRTAITELPEGVKAPDDDDKILALHSIVLDIAEEMKIEGLVHLIDSPFVSCLTGHKVLEKLTVISRMAAAFAKIAASSKAPGERSKFPYTKLHVKWVTPPATQEFSVCMEEEALRKLFPDAWWCGDALNRLIKKFAFMSSKDPEQIDRTEDFSTTSVSPHCEATLIQHIVDNRIPALGYIACSYPTCYACDLYASVASKSPTTSKSFKIGYLNIPVLKSEKVYYPWVAPPTAEIALLEDLETVVENDLIGRFEFPNMAYEEFYSRGDEGLSSEEQEYWDEMMSGEEQEHEDEESSGEEQEHGDENLDDIV